MHDNFQFAAIIVAIFAGILFNRNDAKDLRTDAKDLRTDLGKRFDRVDDKLDLMQRDMKEFYATQRVHDEAIETLKKQVKP